MVDATAVTFVDGLRVRSKPRISDDSFKSEPLLPVGTPLYVLAGPIVAFGYTWYEVAPLSWRIMAGAGLRVQIGTANAGSKPMTSIVRHRRSISVPGGHATWDRTSLLLAGPHHGRGSHRRMQLRHGRSVVTPGWFSGSSGSPELLVEPDVTRPPDDTATGSCSILTRMVSIPRCYRSAGTWEGTSWSKPGLVEVTGIFDHPAAAKLHTH